MDIFGQYLATTIAKGMYKLEDSTLFLGDGSTYGTFTGVGKHAVDNSHKVTTAAGNTAPDQITLDNFRMLRLQINRAYLSEAPIT